ncbi:MAG: hypothetical protein A3I11_03115 [Elusimicrobia bacterium RIFCSPLOWO2_02_FULL_39_32]|nr:MAG: hypothetical protein A2034_05110 [Elusimicrobia bacterium GWA2_38_7]OGR80879.1 MAG: hypothetical protein A3B80_04395 [Elusimicrobia bacterium RIFCSPHIGHO2_02_FULL_39_36]OGR93758.1 MAG: hypothetical protein A3I11_03115 [Elusimicrobia bacterium RIFCSPLOWO2_02_FULL_39_32]OGS00974.1 MAG: hypothetical protein A3G85_07460 [Elusimicrobia bacterium RIFCSPLOWO2_12_FULL_39_28]
MFAQRKVFIFVFLYLTLFPPYLISTLKSSTRSVVILEKLNIPVTSKIKNIKVWMPIPAQDFYQSTKILKIESDLPYKISEELNYKNRFLFFENREPVETGIFNIKVSYQVLRKEQTPRTSKNKSNNFEKNEKGSILKFLEPRGLEMADDEIKRIAEENTKGINDPLEKARAIYQYVLKFMKYDKSGAGWGRGDAVYACKVGKGNCTDFHSLFISLARAVHIPARFRMGVPLPKESEGDLSSAYHCWAEFYNDELGWIPVDISEAWKNSNKANYFFGNLDSDRILLTTGREIVLEPKQNGPALNFISQPYVEIDGNPTSDYALARIYKKHS